jgi:hypothetical protein
MLSISASAGNLPIPVGGYYSHQAPTTWILDLYQNVVGIQSGQGVDSYFGGQTFDYNNTYGFDTTNKYLYVGGPISIPNYPGTVAAFTSAAPSGQYTQIIVQDSTASGQAVYVANANDATNTNHYAQLSMNNNVSPNIANTYFPNVHAAALYNTDPEFDFGTGLVTGTNAAFNFYAGGYTTPSFVINSSGVSVTGNLGLASGHVADSTTAPTIASGFGTTPSIAASNGTAAFTVNVGTGGTASAGVLTMPTSSTGWACTVTPNGTPQAASVTYSAPTSASSVTLTNYTLTTGLALAWPTGYILQVQCRGY